MIPFLAAALRLATGARGASMVSSAIGSGGKAATAATQAGAAATQLKDLQKQLKVAAGKTPLLPQEQKQLASAKAYAAHTAKVSENMERAVQQEQRMSRALGYTSVASSQANRIIVGLASTISGKFVSALTTAIDVLHAAAAPVEALVRLHNPARADLFVRRLTDAQAVIGRMLVPVLDAFTRGAIKLGNFMAGMEPVVRPLTAAMSHFIDKVLTRWVEFATKNAGATEMMIAALASLVDVAATAATALLTLADVILSIPRAVSRVTGFGKSSFDPKGSAFGAAALQARFTGAKTASDDIIKNAMMQGLTKESPEVKKLSETNKLLKGIHDLLYGIFNSVDTVDKVKKEGSDFLTTAGLAMPFHSMMIRFMTGHRG